MSTNSTGINTNALVDGLYANKTKVEDKARDAGHLGGISVFGFGVPNQFLGLDLRSKGQKEAQDNAQGFEAAMANLLNSLSEALNATASPYSK